MMITIHQIFQRDLPFYALYVCFCFFGPRCRVNILLSFVKKGRLDIEERETPGCGTDDGLGSEKGSGIGGGKDPRGKDGKDGGRIVSVAVTIGIDSSSAACFSPSDVKTGKE